MPSLTTLLLTANNDPNVTDIVGMNQLTCLHLSDNPIDDYAQFGALTNLEYLVLNDTNDQIEDLPEVWLTQLKNLRVLSIRGNDGLRKSDAMVRRLLFEVCIPNGGGIAVDK